MADRTLWIVETGSYSSRGVSSVWTDPLAAMTDLDKGYGATLEWTVGWYDYEADPHFDCDKYEISICSIGLDDGPADFAVERLLTSERVEGAWITRTLNAGEIDRLRSRSRSGEM